MNAAALGSVCEDAVVYGVCLLIMAFVGSAVRHWLDDYRRARKAKRC